MSGGKRPGFLIRSFPTTTVQTSKHGDRKPGVQIHCPFRQHCSAAFVTCPHERTLPPGQMHAYPSEVLGLL